MKIYKNIEVVTLPYRQILSLLDSLNVCSALGSDMHIIAENFSSSLSRKDTYNLTHIVSNFLLNILNYSISATLSSPQLPPYSIKTSCEKNLKNGHKAESRFDFYCNHMLHYKNVNNNVDQCIYDIQNDNFSFDESTEYKILNKCKSFIDLSDKKKILKYENLHNHLEKEFEFVDNGRTRNDIVEFWFKCLINLNNMNTNL
ncbi:hypothetical protein H8356DRAFT_1418232 [Neocallimastix lanati (nom. inval.)]|nr:hypothetical protein H8356DRAFT_1418232 [Neocallimastix sp. JGI-2020a]